MSQLVVEEARGADAIDGLRVEWQTLFATAAAAPFLSWEWTASWQRWLGQGRTPRVLCAFAGPRLVGLLALAEEACWGVRPRQVRKLSILGERHVGGDYLDVLAAPGWERESANAIFKHLARDGSFDVLELDGLAGDSPTLPMLAWRFGVDARFKFDLQPGQVCPYLKIDGPWDDVLKQTRRPHQLKRLLRELDSLEGFQLRSALTPEDVSAAFERLLALHAKRWAGQGGSDALARPAVRDFHRDVVSRLARAGMVRVEELWIEGACRASYYGMESGRHYYLYQTGYDPEWAKRSVAFLRMGLSIQEAVGRGIRIYDFLRGSETYKFDWANATRMTVSVQIARRSQAANVYIARRRLRAAAKMALKAGLPTPGLDWLRRRRRSWERRQDPKSPAAGYPSELIAQPLANAAQARS